MRTVVLVPYRGDGAWRTANWRLVSAQVDALRYPVIVGDSGDDPFSCARTWNALAAQATVDYGRWDAAVLWQADFLLEDSAAQVALALETGVHVLAFDQVVTATESETRTVHRGGPWPDRSDPLPFSGVTIIGRDLWDAVGGFDPRFVGWGHEDRAFVHHADRIAGPRLRVPGRMLNLWHPRKVPGDPYWDRRRANHRLLVEMTR